MKRLFYIFLITFTLWAFIDYLNPIEKAQNYLPDRNIEIIANEPEPKVVKIEPFKNILDKVEEGKRLLSHSPLLAIEGKGVKRKEIALAILDITTGDVLERRYWIEDTDIERSNEERTDSCGKIDHYPYLRPVDENPDFFVVVNWWNGHNSNLNVVNYNCSEENRYIVVAAKILINNERLVFPEDRKGKKYSDIVYAPYSEQLHREEIIKEGLDFLNKKTAQAFYELGMLKVKSRAMPEKLVIETMTPSFVKNIFINEQSDPKSMLTSSDGGRRIAERALVRLGLNKDSAFRYTYSPVGALGLGQIMPETYRNIVWDYPEALLIKDIGTGRAEILNAIKASILIFDDHYAAVVRRAKESVLGQANLSKKLPREIEEIRAAIYNGGPGKYQSLTGNISYAIPETVSFLAKFNLIRDLHLFD